MKRELDVCLKIGIAEVVCPQCADLVDPAPWGVAKRPAGLVADCPCGFRIALDSFAPAAALPHHYREHSIRIEVEVADEAGTSVNPARINPPAHGGFN
ncbi:MAG: hypothetical protein F4Y08_15255 [Caldilineaceae bacterium SB0662_bin_9]|uniref:Uncharacterized protein n=1 Tax=Caldilineaceae bacterium SB0662_bin_9 TaxID=2605258 RepID=A0A6B1DY57_9CHLR|nr:hypothetical protein [Caldilineaceae bacterium SB0662_bin_9]